MDWAQRLHETRSERSAASEGLLDEVRRLDTLRAVLAWAFGQRPAAEPVTVVAQDEFTHDVVFRVASGPYVVFDTT